jgi:hypothetical protein
MSPQHFHFVKTVYELFSSLSGLAVVLLVLVSILSIYVFMKVFDSDFKMD